MLNPGQNSIRFELDAVNYSMSQVLIESENHLNERLENVFKRFILGDRIGFNPHFYPIMENISQESNPDQNTSNPFFAEGYEKFNKRDWTGAIEALSEAIKGSPKFFEAYFWRGLAKSELGQNESAIVDFSYIIENSSEGLASTFLNRGNAKVNLGDLPGAIEDFSKAFENEPTFETALVNRGKAKFRLKEYKAAIQDYDEAITLNPFDRGSWKSRGDAKMEIGDVKGAVFDFFKTIEGDYSLARDFFNTVKIKDKPVLDYLTEIINSDPNELIAIYLRGFGRGNFGEDKTGADQDYTRVLEIEPSSPEEYYCRGQVKEFKGDLQGSITDMEKALTLNPGYAVAYYILGIQRFNKEDYKGAEDYFSRVIQINPAFKGAYRLRGNCRSRLKEHSGALEDYNNAIKTDPENGVSFFERALFQINSSHNLNESILDLSEAIRLTPVELRGYFPKKSDMIFLRGRAKSMLGDKEGAIQDFVNAMDTNIGYGYENITMLIESEIGIKHFNEALAIWRNKSQWFDQFGNPMIVIGDPLKNSKITNIRILDSSGKEIVSTKEADEISPEQNAEQPNETKEPDKSNEPELTDEEEKEINDLLGDLYDVLDPCNEGITLYDDGKFEEALQSFTKVIKEDGYNVKAFYGRGLANFEKGYLKDALSDFSEAIKLNNTIADSFLRRGIIKQELEDFVGALGDFSTAIQLDEKNAEAYFFRGRSKEVQEDENGRKLDLDKASHLNPELGNVFIRKGGIRTKVKSKKRAIEYFSLALEFDPGLGDAYFYRGFAKNSWLDYQGAMDDFSECLRLNPNRKYAHKLRGICRQNSKDLEGALEDYDIAISLNPKDGDSLFNRATILFSLGNLKKAEENILLAIQVKPELEKESYVQELLSNIKEEKTDENRHKNAWLSDDKFWEQNGFTKAIRFVLLSLLLLLVIGLIWLRFSRINSRHSFSGRSVKVESKDPYNRNLQPPINFQIGLRWENRSFHSPIVPHWPGTSKLIRKEALIFNFPATA